MYISYRIIDTDVEHPAREVCVVALLRRHVRHEAVVEDRVLEGRLGRRGRAQARGRRRHRREARQAKVRELRPTVPRIWWTKGESFESFSTKSERL